VLSKKQQSYDGKALRDTCLALMHKHVNDRLTHRQRKIYLCDGSERLHKNIGTLTISPSLPHVRRAYAVRLSSSAYACSLPTHTQDKLIRRFDYDNPSPALKFHPPRIVIFSRPYNFSWLSALLPPPHDFAVLPH